MDDIVGKLQKEYNLIDAVVSDFERYIKEVSIVLKGLQEKGAVPADKANYVSYIIIRLKKSNFL